MDGVDKIRPSERASSEVSRFDQIIGNSPALEFVLSEVERVAPTDSTVLILGETGTGKELIAHAIHNLSARCGRPFVKLNCSAIPFDLLESELFGHEKGAFTGAIAQKIGRFEMADTGTIFLDEIGDLPPALQPKLLRVLQEQEFERLGSGRTHRINVRVVAATHRGLTEMVARNEPLDEILGRIAALLETHAPGRTCSIAVRRGNRRTPSASTASCSRVGRLPGCKPLRRSKNRPTRRGSNAKDGGSCTSNGPSVCPRPAISSRNRTSGSRACVSARSWVMSFGILTANRNDGGTDAAQRA